MKTEKELNAAILKITMKIQESFPELSKYISEMPIKVSDAKDKGTKIKNLQDYYNSLDIILKKYILEHNSIKN